MQNQLISFKNSFGGMVDSGVVDMGALEIINNLKEELTEKRIDAIESIKNSKELFPIYHSINISNKVLDSIASRLAVAKEMNDNPIIADDTLNVYPALFKLLFNLDRINLKEGNVVTFHLLSLASDLQIDAIRSNLFKSQKEVDKNLLNRIKEVASDLKIGEPSDEE